MNCPKCNSIVSKRDATCPVCGADLSGVQAPKQNTSAPQKNNTPQAKKNILQKLNTPVKVKNNSPANKTAAPTTPAAKGDSKSTLLNILSFFFPMIGYLYFALNRRVYPVRSRFALSSAVASSAIFLVVYLFMVGYQLG